MIVRDDEKVFKVYQRTHGRGAVVVSKFKWVDNGRNPYNVWEMKLSQDITADSEKFTLETAKAIKDILGLSAVIKTNIENFEVVVE